MAEILNQLRESDILADMRLALGWCAMRTYTAADICELIDLLRGVEDISPAEVAGMNRLGRLLVEFDKMSDADFEEAARRYFLPAKHN